MFDVLRKEIHDAMERYRRRDMLDAIAAACAFGAAADEEFALSDSHRMDELIDGLVSLKVFDPRVVKGRFNEFVDLLLHDHDAGRNAVLKELKELSGDKVAADIVVKTCVALSWADGSIDPRAGRAINQIAAALGVHVPDIEEELLKASLSE